jgi:MFS family permease
VRKKLPATVYALGLTSLLNDAASDMIYPLLPLFLATSAGAGAAALGLIEGAAEAMAAFLKIVSGHVSDRTQRRKPFVVAGYAVASLARPFLALVSSASGVLALRLIDRFGKGVRSSPRDALIADVVAPADRGRAFGLHEAMDHLGAVIGPLAASGLLVLGFGLPTVFLASAVPALAACLVVALVVRESPRHPTSATTVAVTAPPPVEAQTPMAIGGGQDRLPLPSRRPFLGYLAAVTVFSMAGSADAFLVLRAHELGFSPVALPVLWAMHNGVKALTGTHGGIVADRFGRRRALAGGWIVYAGVYAGFGWANSRATIIALFVVYGLHRALVAGAQKALVADLVPPESRARGYGIYYTCVGLTLLPASAVFGLLYQKAGSAVAFGTGAVIALLAVAMLPLSRVRTPQPG